MKDTKHSFLFRFAQNEFSLSRRGAWGQVTVASLLITVLPALILVWLLECHRSGVSLQPVAVWSAYGGSIFVITLGYALLLKYPVSIVRLRSYLSTLVDGKIPAFVSLSKNEDDLAAVQQYMEGIVKMAEERVRMIKSQYENKLEAERQRVMVESIGTMCHHLGQPATIMSMCLYRLQNNRNPGEAPAILAEFETAFNAMSEILAKLRATAHYCTESYLHPSSEQSGTAQEKELRIIKS